MRALAAASLIVLLALSAALAQSGRRTTPTPTPSTPADPSEYSESKPRPPRQIRPAMDTNGIIAAPQTTSSPEDADGDTIKSETNLITIPVSVFDRNGLYIPGLRQTDFKIFEDGVEQEIAYFGAQDKPFTVALLLDVSPSTAYKIEEIREAARSFVDKLGPNDKVIVIDFDHSVNVRTEPTNDRDKIYSALKKAKFGDGTSLYNAVDEALRKQLGRIQGRKAVVLFTDGVDTTSRKNTYDGTVNFAEESDSLVFPIYYNTYLDNSRPLPGGGGILGAILGGGGSRMGTPGTSSEEYVIGKRYLEELSEATGGRVFRPEATPGGLTAAFEGIAEELRRQYNIGYIPSNEGRMGQKKAIKVRVNRPNLIIRSRDSYIVGRTGTPAVQPTPSPSPIKN